MSKKIRPANQDIRKRIKNSSIYGYMVADQLGISSSSFYLLLQGSLKEDTKQNILNAISTVEKEATAE